jgi:mannose-1-phosphate guanylyltransferase
LSSHVKAFVLAAGLGTRLKPLTDRIPKCLVPITGRPLLDYWVDNLANAGVTEARINTHAHADQVRAYIADVNQSCRLMLTEFHEPSLLGSAGTISANSSFAEDASEIIIVYADNLSEVNLEELLAFHRSHSDPFTILLNRVANPRACGIVEIDSEGRVLSFEEKPQHPRGDLANAGIYIVSPEVYREMAAMGAFDLGTDVLPRFIGRMRGCQFDGYHRDIGTHEALAEAQAVGHSFVRIPRSTTFPRPAVFLDRDGTLIEHVHYLSRPDQVRLVPEAAESLHRLVEAGFACVVVTNQSVVGHGIITETDLHFIHEEMNRQLAEGGVKLDAIYYCTATSSGKDRTKVEHPDRKPAPGMLLRAAREHNLDLSQSWMIGDMISDILAGRNAGCRGNILVLSGPENEGFIELCPSAEGLPDAVDMILNPDAMALEASTISESRR